MSPSRSIQKDLSKLNPRAAAFVPTLHGEASTSQAHENTSEKPASPKADDDAFTSQTPAAILGVPTLHSAETDVSAPQVPNDILEKPASPKADTDVFTLQVPEEISEKPASPKEIKDDLEKPRRVDQDLGNTAEILLPPRTVGEDEQLPTQEGTDHKSAPASSLPAPARITYGQSQQLALRPLQKSTFPPGGGVWLNQGFKSHSKDKQRVQLKANQASRVPIGLSHSSYAPLDTGLQHFPQSGSLASPDQTILTRKGPKPPIPSIGYLATARIPAQRTDSAQRLLIIIDLNGTLLYRPKWHKSKHYYIPRSGITEFFDYLFANHAVMVWSSAQPDNVHMMCSRLFTPQQHSQLLALWSRKTLGLTNAQYHDKVQVYKRLTKVWNDPIICPEGRWDQKNTVLIDDSVEKSKGEPYNAIVIPEFKGEGTEGEEFGVLNQVMVYLEEVRGWNNVSSFMAKEPFSIV
ncbi:MAG: hypothetical protein M1820_010681 [Bogoriella megaspora]|nr:MAG: hypothetical protein M1820_010681 [Bogoriella megaspora]